MNKIKQTIQCRFIKIYYQECDYERIWQQLEKEGKRRKTRQRMRRGEGGEKRRECTREKENLKNLKNICFNLTNNF